MDERWTTIPPLGILLIAAAWFAAALVALWIFVHEDFDAEAARASLIDDLARAPAARGTARYEYADTDEQTADVFSVVLYAGDGERRIDFERTAGPGESAYFTRDAIYLCNDSLQACTLEATGPPPGLPFFLPLLFESDTITVDPPDVEAVSERRIAGIPARCYEMTLPRQGETFVEVCFADDGWVLAGSYRDANGSVSFQAIQLDRQVDPGAFDLPYPVVGSSAPATGAPSRSTA